MLARGGIVPVVRDFSNADYLQVITFWNKNFATVVDALARAKPRPRSKYWVTVEPVLGRQFRDGRFESVKEAHLIMEE